MHSLVSVIIPNYNCAPYLRQAVESALSQTYRPLEITVVDDGSTDESLQQIADLVESGRVRLVRRENGGVAAARNTGIAHSVGDYLMFLDCDDYLQPTMIERLMALLEAEAPNVFAYCSYTHVNAEGKPLPNNRPLSDYRVQLEGNLLAPLLMGAYMVPVCLVISRALVQQLGGFDPEYTAGDDYALLLRASCIGATARFLDQPLAFYRHRPGSQSQNSARMALLNFLLLRDIVERFPMQVAHTIPRLVEEFRHNVTTIWRDGSERLGQAEQYAASLEEALAARTVTLEEAASYAQNLEATVQTQNTALVEVRSYAASLETALADATAYAKSLEATVQQRNAALADATAYARSLEQERQQLVQAAEQETPPC